MTTQSTSISIFPLLILNILKWITRESEKSSKSRIVGNNARHKKTQRQPNKQTNEYVFELSRWFYQFQNAWTFRKVPQEMEQKLLLSRLWSRHTLIVRQYAEFFSFRMHIWNGSREEKAAAAIFTHEHAKIGVKTLFHSPTRFPLYPSVFDLTMIHFLSCVGISFCHCCCHCSLAAYNKFNPKSSTSIDINK